MNLRIFKFISDHNNYNPYSPSSFDGILSSYLCSRLSLQEIEFHWVDLNILVTAKFNENLFEASICYWIKLTTYVQP